MNAEPGEVAAESALTDDGKDEASVDPNHLGGQRRSRRRQAFAERRRRADALRGTTGDANVDRAERLVRDAVGRGAQVVLLPELFESLYFCRTENPAHFDLARPFEGNPLIERFAALAAELEVVLPLSFFERAGQTHFNSLAMIDADGRVLGPLPEIAHPRRTGLRRRSTTSRRATRAFGCGRRASPRSASASAGTSGFPSARGRSRSAARSCCSTRRPIGSEPHEPGYDSQPHWETVMRGHAAANLVPVAAANRIGQEAELAFYGSSFIAGATGEVLVRAPRRRRGRSTRRRRSISRRSRAGDVRGGCFETDVPICTGRSGRSTGRRPEAIGAAAGS